MQDRRFGREFNRVLDGNFHPREAFKNYLAAALAVSALVALIYMRRKKMEKASLNRIVASIFALVLMGGALGGCLAAAAAGAGAGYVAHDESTEGDGNFDPLEDARGEGDGRN